MKHIGSHLKKKKDDAPDRRTERGELMKFFCERLNVERKKDGIPPLNMGRMGRLLQGIPTKDLYYLQTVCTQAKNFSKKFWWEIKNHDDLKGDSKKES